MKRKFLSVFLCILLLGMLTACSSEKTESSSKSEVSQNTTTQEEASSVESVSEPAEELESPVVIPKETTNLLTGEETLSPEAYGKRPVAVSVNNIKDCWPQDGISSADILFEIPVEYNITRLMAVYGDDTKIPEVCSIRSCRYYFPILAAGMDARYIHCGMDEVHARPIVDNLGIDTLDAAYDDGTLFVRDQARLDQGYAWEHTLVFLGPEYPEAAEKDGSRRELGDQYRDTVFRFASKRLVPEGESCTKLCVTFDSSYFSDFYFDPTSGMYLKDHSGTPHMDAAAGKQLAFDNLLILETEIHSFEGDESGRKEIKILGENHEGYYVSEGKVQPIRWSKYSEFGPLLLTDLKGEELLVNQGKTYVAVCQPGSVDFYEENA